MPDVKILGIPGSLRQASFNRFALRAAQSLVPPGASLDIFELDGIPPYNQDHEKQPPARVVELKAADTRGGRDPLLHPGVQLLRCPACSRTRSTGPRGPTATARGRASRWR